MPRIDILAGNAEQTGTVLIQVKTKRSGTWQASVRAGMPREAVPEEQRFWIFVDLRENPIEPPAYYIVDEWWTQNDIYVGHQAYLKRADGTRTRSPDSPHHAIPLSRIMDSKDRWDRLGIL